MPLIEIDLPEYSIATEPDHKAIGKVVDDVLRLHFAGRAVIVRGISSGAHPGKSVGELAKIVGRTGTDRYDPDRAGDRYENTEGRHIDLFAFRRTVTSRMQLFRYISWGFYHGSKTIHGKPVRVDLLTIYDGAQLKAVAHRYDGRPDIKRDGYAFRDPAKKQAAVLGVIVIN